MTTRIVMTVAGLLMACVPVPSRPPRDPALLGCWRAQHQQQLLSDKTSRDLNADCVLEYDGARVHSRCRGVEEHVSAYELLAPGRIRVTPLDAAGKPAAAPNEMHYRIVDGNWIVLTRQYDAPALPRLEGVERLTSLGVREDAACQPRGDTGIRIGRTSVSSLALGVPEGWRPLLVDPAKDPQLVPLIRRGFFIGAFASTAANPVRIVVVIDDARYGPTPIRAAEFAKVRERFASELAPARLTCDFADRACAIVRLPEGGMAYTELFLVRGRVARVASSASDGGEDTPEALADAAKVFVNQLRHDNP